MVLDKYRVGPFLIKPGKIRSTSTNSEGSLEFFHRQFETCLQTHNCGSELSTRMPTRLLDLSLMEDNMEEGYVRLVETAKLGKQPYVALCHCW
jgi:hypothetical protein